ncbi:hypothetical protein AUJ46_00995 [Candidatus Peregrinibacteria bacterium CG1_02_54_53]|nr:MAG: hypothetical protein AUJ46_00995 [Candidatus Peregrinibacteria bacterium CG1_02_54_53]
MQPTVVSELIRLSRPVMGDAETEAVIAVLRTGQIAQGKVVSRFEHEFAALCGTRHAVATSSGTTALCTALLAHGIGRGDEVITTPFTFIATINSILSVGATPILVDIESETFNINPALIERAISPRTRAIMPVHLFGHLCAMDDILDIAQKHHLVVIEDAAQAAGAKLRERHAGTFGTGCFSFYATKNLTCGEGGAVITDDDTIAERCRMVRNHGMRQRYHHEMLGFNYRMNEISAAIGLCQLAQFDKMQRCRAQNAEFLQSHLYNVGVPIVRDNYTHAWHQFTVKTPFQDAVKRNVIVDDLRKNGIEAGIFYPLPVHRQAYLVGEFSGQSFSVAEEMADRVFSLPIHPHLSLDELERITAVVNRI